MSDESKRDAQAPREKWATTTDAHRTDFARAESPLKYRAGAVALWAVGLACALAGTAVAAGLLAVPVLGDLPVLVIVVAVLVALVCALAGQRLWEGGRRGGRQAAAAGRRRRVVLGVCADVPVLPGGQERPGQAEGGGVRGGRRGGCGRRGHLPAGGRRGFGRRLGVGCALSCGIGMAAGDVAGMPRFPCKF